MEQPRYAGYVIVAAFLAIPAIFVWRGVANLIGGDIADGLILGGFGLAIIAGVLALVAYARRNASGGSDVNSKDLITRTVSRWTGQGGCGFGS